MVQGLALRGDHHVSVIQRTGDGVALGIAHTDIDTQLPGAAEELTHLRPVGQQGVVVVHLPVLAAHGLAAAHGEAEGHAVGVAGDEQLRKDNELRALAGGLVDEPQGLLKTFVLAEHHRGGLHHRHAAGVLQISHGSTSLQNDTMIIPDGHAGTQQVSAQDAAAVVQWIFLFAMKRDGRKGSANPSRPMESRRLTPPRLDRNRNAHPSAGIGGAFW